MAALVELSGKGFQELFSDLCHTFEVKYERNCKAPPCETLRLLLKLLEFNYLERPVEENSRPTKQIGLAASDDKKDQHKSNIDISIQELCKGCIHLLLHRDLEIEENEGRTTHDLIQKIVIECCKVSTQGSVFVLEFCIINIEEFAKACIKEHIVDKERINRLISDRSPQFCSASVIPISRVLGLLLSLTRSESAKNHSIGGITELDGKLFHSLLEMLTCGADDAVTAIVSQIISFYLNTNINKKNLWKRMEQYSRENDRNGTPYAVISLLLAQFLNGEQFDIREANRFMSFIQNGLLHADALTRKRAVFILKWIVDVSSKQANEKDNCWSNMDSFILLIETLEEKQLHVILPVLSSVQEIINLSMLSSNGESILHVSWLTTVLTRAFDHDNKFITKWAIETCLQLDIEKLGLLTDGNWGFITGPLLGALGESHLYEKEGKGDDTNPPPLAQQLRGFLLKCKNSCRAEYAKDFFKQVLLSFFESNFSAIPFTYIAEVLSCIEIPGLVDLELLTTIKTYLLSSISMFPSELQAAAHYLVTQTVFNCIDTEVSWKELIAFLKIIFERGYVTYGSKLWANLRDKMLRVTSLDLRNNLDTARNSLAMYLSDKTEDAGGVEEVGLALLLAVDVTRNEPDKTIERNITQLLEPIITVLSKIGRNPYLSRTEIHRSLRITEFIIRKCNENTKLNELKLFAEQQKVVTSVMDVLLKYVFPCLHYFRDILLCVLRGEEFNVNTVLSSLVLQRTVSEHIVTSYSSKEASYDTLVQHFHHLVEMCSKVISESKELSISDGTSFALNALNMVCDFVESSEGHDVKLGGLETSLIELIKTLNLNVNFKSRATTILNENLRISSDIKSFNCSLWSLICFALKKNDIRRQVVKNTSLEALDSQADVISLSRCDIHQLTGSIINAIDVSVGRDIAPLLNCLELLVADVHSISEDLAIDIIHTSWRVFMEQRRRDAIFWITYEPVVKIIFCSSFLLRGSEKVIEIVRSYWSQLEVIGEAKSNAFNVVLDHCCRVWKSCLVQESLQVQEALQVPADAGEVSNAAVARRSLLNFIDLLADSCIFGKLQKKVTRITHQTIAYFKANYVEDSVMSNNNNNDYQVRTAAAKLLLGLNADSAENSELVCKFFEILIEKDREICDKVKRYYNNSLIHRQKLRIWQTVLVLLQFIPERNARDLITLSMAVMVSENQPSARYYIEWFVILLVHKYPQLRSLVWEKLDEATEKRISSITSLMSIIGHLAVILPGEQFSEMASEAFRRLLPWVQVHHMQARIHAQVVIGKLWQEAKNRKLDEVLDEFRIIESLFSLKEANASVVKARKEIQNNFYFKSFHPLRHYSLETIFSTLPKLSNIAEDEVLDAKKFNELIVDENCLVDVKVYDYHPSLVEETNKDQDQLSSIEVKSSSEVTATPTDVQKKITAWKPSPPTDDPFLQKADMYKSKTRQSKLVLCASLIDRIPNLGGLCRTCEIFGAATLTIGAMRYLEDMNFKSLSVTSEKWMDIQQVLPRHLEKYLRDMKTNGYRIVGIEQTANSKPLQEYEFQEKTVLVLGNEKEGIPVKLIQLLDDCVEIPQQGVIRSLNVHVSGAIIIWEYFKQSLVKEAQHK